MSHSHLFILDKNNSIDNYPCGILDMIGSFNQKNYNIILSGSYNVLKAIYTQHSNTFRDSEYIVRNYSTNITNFRPISDRKYLIKVNNTTLQICNFLNRNRNFRAIKIQ